MIFSIEVEEETDGRWLAEGQGQPIPLLPFTDPNFGMEDTRITFVRNRDGTIHGVLLIRGDGSSIYAWRASRSAAR